MQQKEFWIFSLQNRTARAHFPLIENGARFEEDHTKIALQNKFQAKKFFSLKLTTIFFTNSSNLSIFFTAIDLNLFSK